MEKRKQQRKITFENPNTAREFREMLKRILLEKLRDGPGRQRADRGAAEP